METKIIFTPTLNVEVVTGDTCYSGRGFSSISAKITSDDADLVGTLSRAQDCGDVITLRCAMIDVTGKITNCIRDGEKNPFVMVTGDLTYRKPETDISPPFHSN